MPTGTKRKSDITAPATKRARKSPGAKIVDAILADPDDYEIPEDEDEVRELLVSIANYANELRAAATSGGGAGAAMSEDDVKAAAETLRSATQKGILRQMTWKPSCKTGRAKFVFDGVCADPAVFGEMLRLDGPPKWKMKKFTREELEKALGSLSSSARYSYLYISKTVNVRYNGDGEFKISGSYGVDL